jgi:hypothetical protein
MSAVVMLVVLWLVVNAVIGVLVTRPATLASRGRRVGC